MPQKPSTQRLTREEWLAHALDALAVHGERVLSVDALAREIGVSRGSFYWHFKDRTDFVRQLVRYWAETYTESVPKHVETVVGTASDRLLALMDAIIRSKGDLYEVPVRAWAARDPVAARLVRKVDHFRMDYVRSLFSELGFKGEELEIRTRTFVVYVSLEFSLFIPDSKKTRLARLKALQTFFTRP